MGLFSIFTRRNEKRALPLSPTVGTTSMIFGGASDAGPAVNENTALTASAVWAAVACIADTISCLPVHVLESASGAKQFDHPLYALLHDQPNEYMTAASFRTAMMTNLLLWGNGYAAIERDSAGRPTGLYPMLSSATRTGRTADGLLYYTTYIGTQAFTLRPDEVFHVLGLTPNGITGLSPIEYAKRSVGLSIALEKFASKFFSNGGNLSGILELPAGMPDEAIKNFLATWRREHTGIENSLKVGLLTDGAKFHQTGTDPEKGQMVDTRVHQLREVARIFRVPPHKIGDLERATFSNIEHQSLEFMQDGIAPWTVKWEQEARRKLLLEVEKPRLEVRFNLDAMLRADTKSRYEAHASGLNSGFLTTNEVRAKEGLPPVEGGDVLRVPLNMGPAAPTPPAPTTPAARALLEDAARRLLVKEAKAAQRAAKKHAGKPDEFRAWATEFYTRHEPLVEKTLAAGKDAAAFAKAHCQESREALVSAFTAGTLEDTLDEWEALRPIAIAERLTKDTI
ncbi:MAG: phage portal protein [Planctomycetes bacterium]|nr:phage portal protein [Planctomycetota bacterium]